MQKYVVFLGFVLIVLGVMGIGLIPYTYTETVAFEGSVMTATITDTGNNPYGLWLSIIGLAVVFVGVALGETNDILKE